MAKLTTYDSKLRLITHALPGTEAVTILVLAGAGSRYETKDINGISHFLEHMFFKGGKVYQTTKAVSEAIDSIGGEFNAFTGKEYAGYYVKVASEHIQTAISVLSDMLITPNLAPEEIEKERGVILEEYNMYQDTPMYQISWAFESLLFGDQPIGWDQIGTKKLIRSVNQDQFRSYLNDLYTPDNIVIGICGKFSEEETDKLIKKHFDKLKGNKNREYLPYKKTTSSKRVKIISKKTEQAHLVIGSIGPDINDSDRWAASILTTVLGGNMSSRMFLSVREDQGLAYYISTSSDPYSDTGIISTRAGVDTTRLQQAIKAILKQYEEVAKDGITKEELQKAKNYLQGKILLNLEDSEEYAHFLCRQNLLQNKLESVTEIKAKINAVTIEEVHKVAKQYLDISKMNVAVIGPYNEKDATEITKLIDQ